MTYSGKVRRLSRIISTSGKTVIVPIDHGPEAYYPQLVKVEQLIKDICSEGVDALLLRRGVISKVSEHMGRNIGLIYRVTGATGTDPLSQTAQKVLSSVEEAIRYGADAIVFTVTAGHPSESEMFAAFCQIVEIAESHGLPVVGEVDVFDASKPDAWEEVRRLSRALGEEGADIVKAYFPGSRSHYRDIISYSLVPVIAAGGSKAKDPKEVLHFVEAVMDAGAIGPCIGRNIWQYVEPSRMVRAIKALVEEEKTINEAIKILRV